MLTTLAWPGVALAISFGFMLIFRVSIKDVLGRTKKIGTGSIGIEAAEPPPQLPAPVQKKDGLAEFMSTFDNPLMRETEASIIADLRSRNLEELDRPAVKVLIRALASTQIQVGFDRISNEIFRAQIDLLTLLGSRPFGATLDECQAIFDRGKRQDPVRYQHSNLEMWLGFLESYKLIERNPKEPLVQLAMMGREYLKWRIDVKRFGPFIG